jgi:hypothetical protein
MGVTVSLKQISPLTLDILTQDPELFKLFSDSQWLPNSAMWERSSLPESYASQFKQDAESKFKGSVYSVYKERFVSEWIIPELDLHKYWPELTYLLAGFIPNYSARLTG